MLFIAGKPIIQYVIESLAVNGIRDIILVVGYYKEKIFDYLEQGAQFGVNIRYIHQIRQLGTANALSQAREITGEEFLVLPGNKIIAPETISQFLGAPAPAVLIKKVNNPERYGVVSLEDGKLLKIVEKPSRPESDYINAGIYLFRKNIFQYIDPELDIPDAINKMIARGESVHTVTTDQTWLDIVYPWDILRLNPTVLTNISRRQSGTIEAGVLVKDAVSIGENTVIRGNSYIAGPVIIGRGCEIGPNVCILPATSIGNNVTISPFTEIRNSVIGDDVFLGSGSFIEDSVLDAGCVIGPHFCAVSAETEIKIEAEHHTTKVGAMLGQGCQVGSGVTARAGTILGNFTQVKPLKLIEGRTPDRSMLV